MAGKTVSPGGFAAALRRLAKDIPAGVERAMDDAALELRGSLVQDAIASTSPQPVDRAQYKGGWRKRRVKGGAIVYNATKQALWIERGRGPGPVPLKPILAWVKRKGLGGATTGRKGLRRGKGGRFIEDPGTLNLARAIQQKIMKRGIKPRWVLRRAVLELRAGRLGAAIQRQLRGLRP